MKRHPKCEIGARLRLSLRRGGITSLLGPVDRRLDLYAEESEFLLLGTMWEQWIRVESDANL